MSRLHVRIVGVVQGVGFRWFVRERAHRLGLAGWVRNRQDGTVEVLASGDPAQLELLRRELLRGPDGAVVEGVEPVNDDAAQPPSEPFDIVRG